MADPISTYSDVIVDFWAPWCQPCKTHAPIVDSWERSGLVPVVRMNVDESSALASQLGVQSLPTLVRLQHGVSVATERKWQWPTYRITLPVRKQTFP